MPVFGDTFTNYVAEHLNCPNIVMYLEMIKILNIGFAKQVDEMTLGLWVRLHEAIHDLCVRPARQMTVALRSAITPPT
ncbi:5161_t:CDS:1, partial [Paraglomus occultum]